MPFIKNKVIDNSDTWKVINTSDIPEGIESISLPKVELVELLTKQQASHVIIPLEDKIQTQGITAKTVSAISDANDNNKIGVWVSSHATTEQLNQMLEQTDYPEVILIDVIDFNNGRAFSLAQHLRLQGYEGEIRLTGKFGIDQLAYYQRAGIDSFGIADIDNLTDGQKQDLDTAFDALATSPTGKTADELPMFR